MAYNIKRDQRVVVILWGVLVFLFCGLLVLSLHTLIESVTKVLIALLTVIGGLVAIIVTYALQRAKDREIELLKSRQLRYLQLIEALTPFVRNTDAERDSFVNVYLQAWLVGSAPVLEATKRFIDDRSEHSLSDLINAMRNDLHLLYTDDIPPSNAFAVENLFVDPPPKGSLRKGN